VTTALPLRVPSLAVMVAAPSATAVTMPLWSTVATLVSLLFHASVPGTVLPTALLAVPLSASVAPAEISVGVGLTVT